MTMTIAPTTPRPAAPALPVLLRTRRAVTDRDWSQVRHLLADHAAWSTARQGLGQLALGRPGALHELADPAGTFGQAGACALLAQLDERRVGVVGVAPATPLGVAELRQLWVAPDARRSGAGDALVVAALDTARRLGHQAIRLVVAPGPMAPAHALFLRHGFVPTGIAGAGLLTMELALD
jgi:GNAT superfamily N-acetyltransferase